LGQDWGLVRLGIGVSVHFLSKWSSPNPEAKEQLRRQNKGQKLAGIRMKENAP